MVHQFEKMTKVDYDYFWRRISPHIPATDEYGNEILDDQGEVVMVPDPEAWNNPQPIPNKTKCLATLVWMANRDRVPGLTVTRIESELTYGELWELLNSVTTDNPNEGGVTDEQNPFGQQESRNEPPPTGTPSEHAAN